MVRNEKLTRHTDERGFVFEPVEGSALASQRNTHVVVSRPWAVRGNHYHPKGTEILVVCGSARVRVRHHDEIRDFLIAQEETVRLVIPPGVSHAVQNTGKKDTLLVAFNTEPHDPDSPDTVRDILL